MFLGSTSFRQSGFCTNYKLYSARSCPLVSRWLKEALSHEKSYSRLNHKAGLWWTGIGFLFVLEKIGWFNPVASHHLAIFFTNSLLLHFTQKANVELQYRPVNTGYIRGHWPPNCFMPRKMCFKHIIKTNSRSHTNVFSPPNLKAWPGACCSIGISIYLYFCATNNDRRSGVIRLVKQLNPLDQGPPFLSEGHIG